MSVCNQIHAAQNSRVITLLDRTDVSVRWDLLQSLGLRVQLIQFVKVANSTYSEPQSLAALLMSGSLLVSAKIMDIV